MLLRSLGGAALAALGVVVVLSSSSASRPVMLGGLAVDPRILGALIVLGVVGAAVLAARTENRLVVGPEGLRMPGPGGPTRAQTALWRDIAQVGVVRGWHPHLVVVTKDHERMTCRLLPQAWPASSLVALLEHHRRKSGGRSALVHPDAVERFRS